MSVLLDTQAAQAAAVFHALSDPTRIAILRQLTRGEQCVCELTDITGAAQSRLSFHLKTLRDAGLVLDRREGRWVYYSLNQSTLDSAVEFAEGLRLSEESWVQGDGCCR